MIKKIALILTLLVVVMASGFGLGRRGAAPEVRSARLAAEFGKAISVYDDIFRAVGAELGYDWRFIGAIAYHESRFTPDIVSQRGASGLMQIMPVVCRHFDIDEEDILDPMTNVRLAGRLLSEIERMLGLGVTLPDEERMGIVLAGYNCGVGHVSDARRLARASGDNPDSWRVVMRYLELKSHPEYYRRPEVRSGRFAGGRKTQAYVSDVMSRYRHYCTLVPEEPAPASVLASATESESVFAVVTESESGLAPALVSASAPASAPAFTPVAAPESTFVFVPAFASAFEYSPESVAVIAAESAE